MAESEQQASSERSTEDPEENGLDMLRLPAASASSWDQNSYIMRDWMLVAAGLERLFFAIYALAFAIITSVYV